MLYFIIEKKVNVRGEDYAGDWQQTHHRPFKRTSLLDAIEVFNAKIDESDRVNYRLRRVERQDFFNAGGV